MKRTAIICLIISCTFHLTVSCNHHRNDIKGFENVPQDTLRFDLKDYVHPDSRIQLERVVKCGGQYYFIFNEYSRAHLLSILISASEDNLKTKHIPLPGDVTERESILVRNDSLIIKLNGERYYSLNPKNLEWESYAYNNKEGLLYEDEDWEVRHSNHGEFGNATWFMNKHSMEEYAFVGLHGSIRKNGDMFYIIKSSRIYGLNDPSIGFHCDSSTRYENAKGSLSIAQLFCKSGYEALKHSFSPIIHLDDESPEIERHEENVLAWFSGGFELSPYATADTIIIAPFIASDSLFCTLNTPSGLNLAKLDDGHLSIVHRFNKDIGAPKLQYYATDNYHPCIASFSRYKDSPSSQDEKLLFLRTIGAGSSELIDISHDGCTVLAISYSPS